MRRYLVAVMGVVALLAAFVGTLAYLSETPSDATLRLAEVDGAVTVTDADARVSDARPGTPVEPLDRVATGDGARAVLELGDETRIRLGPESTVQVKSADEEGVELELEGGALQATVRPDSGSLRLSNDGREALITDGDISMAVDPAEDLLLFETTRGEAMLGGIVGVSQLGPGQRLVVGGDHAQLGRIPEDMLLAVEWPDNPRTRDAAVVIPGQTAPGATVRITGSAGTVEVRADDGGSFTAEVPLFEGENSVRVEAVDMLGNATEARGVLERDQSGPTFRGGVEYGP